MASELTECGNQEEVHKLSKKILAVDKIETTLNYFDGFKDFHSYSEREQYGLVHNMYDYCFEKFIKVIYEVGLRAGNELLDEKVTTYIRPVYQYLIKKYPFYATIIISALLKLGYDYDDMIEFALHRVDQLHRLSLTNEFDIYVKQEDIKHVFKWMKGNLILKDKYSPYKDDLPLPLHLDIEMLSRIPKKFIDEQTSHKLEDIMHYIEHPEYQRLNGDYGWMWEEEFKTYHAANNGFCIPLYYSDKLMEKEFPFFLNDTINLSYSKVFRSTEYYDFWVKHLEQYKTERGTYCFPEQFFWIPLKTRLWQSLIIDEKVFKNTKKDQVKTLALEIYSTYLVELIKHNLKLV